MQPVDTSGVGALLPRPPLETELPATTVELESNSPMTRAVLEHTPRPDHNSIASSVLLNPSQNPDLARELENRGRGLPAACDNGANAWSSRGDQSEDTYDICFESE